MTSPDSIQLVAYKGSQLKELDNSSTHPQAGTETLQFKGTATLKS